MRILISFLALIIILLICNIVAYTISEDYRFFLKKMKYQEDVVYEEDNSIDDTSRHSIKETINEEGKKQVEVEEIKDTTGIFFIENITKNTEDTKERGELLLDEKKIKKLFEEKFILRENEEADEKLFGLTWEYPEIYREYQNSHFTLYMFIGKGYTDVQKILEVLSYELPYELNEVNNFATRSLYINMQSWYEDDFVRILFEYENLAFWLKIKKDSYNGVKEILNRL